MGVGEGEERHLPRRAPLDEQLGAFNLVYARVLARESCTIMAELGLGSALHCPQGDNYALALAYFQTGLPDGGWDLLQGNLYHDMFNYMSPGALGSRESSRRVCGCQASE